MRKNILTVLLSLSLLAALCVGTAFAEEAAPTSDSLIRDGVPQTPTVYKINGSNYFKIRDLAAILNGTAKQFSVGYDAEKQSVTADTGAGYVRQPTDLAGAPAGGSKTAQPSSDAIYINGVLCQAEVYKIDGMNYFKLRDLGQALDFAVGWDDATKTVALDTTRGYETQTSPAQNLSDRELMKLAEESVNDRDIFYDRGSIQLDKNDSIITDKAFGGDFGDVTAYRVIGCSTAAQAEAKMREAWYQTYSRRYPTFETDSDVKYMRELWVEYNGKVYQCEDPGGRGSNIADPVIDRIATRTADEVVFRGHWEIDGENIGPIEVSLVFEDGTWKYGYFKDSYELENP